MEVEGARTPSLFEVPARSSPAPRRARRRSAARAARSPARGPAPRSPQRSFSGARERGSSASRPPSRYAARRRWRCRRENPYSAAAAVTDCCWETTWRTATRARDIPAQSAHPRTAARGDRRYGVALRAPPPRRPPQPQASTPPPGETYVPTHEGRITWDICREPRHPLSAAVMSRDIGLRCLGTWVSFWGARPAAGLFVLVAPVGLVGLDRVD